MDYNVSKGKFQFIREITEYFPKSQFLFKEYGMRLRDFEEKKAKEPVSP